METTMVVVRHRGRLDAAYGFHDDTETAQRFATRLANAEGYIGQPSDYEVWIGTMTLVEAYDD